ncbi:hypothetical protein RHSIM_Rhsim11G0079400 [Rhododendron simsii]|uniref:Uncharacterized protein n=1 Tax=Rhododendron simsii TaxID=118357 RepID=A0A834L9T9_RHOSS|nr:hypothetical protein RHSIM_Rhsim11G0079400 [Rhododendron simsii]
MRTCKNEANPRRPTGGLVFTRSSGKPRGRPRRGSVQSTVGRGRGAAGDGATPQSSQVSVGIDGAARQSSQVSVGIDGAATQASQNFSGPRVEAEERAVVEALMLAGAVVVETEEGELMVEGGVVLEPEEGALMVEGAGLEGVVQ